MSLAAVIAAAAAAAAGFFEVKVLAPHPHLTLLPPPLSPSNFPSEIPGNSLFFFFYYFSPFFSLFLSLVVEAGAAGITEQSPDPRDSFKETGITKRALSILISSLMPHAQS